MGTFTHTIIIQGPLGAQTIEALVDTGATFSSFPASVLEEVGARPFRTVRLRLANREVEERPIGQVEATINGLSSPILCLFSPPQAPALIGAHALEAFLLAVDPVEQRLVPRDGLLLRYAAERIPSPLAGEG